MCGCALMVSFGSGLLRVQFAIVARGMTDYAWVPKHVCVCWISVLRLYSGNWLSLGGYGELSFVDLGNAEKRVSQRVVGREDIIFSWERLPILG